MLKLSNQRQVQNYRLLRCHPITSSVPNSSDIPDNDIVLINSAGKLARFEVSDVSGTSDSNRKEPKDLASLGIRSGDMNDILELNPFVDCLFMVVSHEMGTRIRRRMTYKPLKHLLYYEEHVVSGQTCIFEVLPL